MAMLCGDILILVCSLALCVPRHGSACKSSKHFCNFSLLLQQISFNLTRRCVYIAEAAGQTHFAGVPEVVCLGHHLHSRGRLNLLHASYLAVWKVKKQIENRMH
jgi:hypothetical protein